MNCNQGYAGRDSFACLPQANMIVSLRQAAASNSPPDWNAFCQEMFPFMDVGAAIDRPHLTAGFSGGK